MLYRIEGLKKIYGGRTVLDISTLTVEAGRIHGLLGPNGAGKTTLLNILGFLDAPTTGRIYYRGKAVQYTEAALQPLRKAVVMLDQHPVLFTTTVYKNLEFGLKIRGWTKIKRERMIHETLDLVGMRNFSLAQGHRLSGGETQRVALARALALNPRVLLCDEPTASVDPENQTAIIRILQRINREKQISVLFTSHNRFQAARLAQEVLFLEHGRLSPTGTDNIFAANHVRGKADELTCTIQENLCLVLGEKHARPPDTNFRILIDPAQIEIVKSQRDGRDTNTFRGKVIQITEDRDVIRLVVDVGAWIALYMPPIEYRQQRLLVGMPITIRIPAEAVRYL
jgi:tungstate transport system ATP-binding protein